MGNVKSNLNVYICGKTSEKENLSIIDNLFPNKKADEILYNSDIKLRVKENIKSEKDFSISWRCFIIDKAIDINISEKLINHIIYHTESLREKEYNNAILYFSDDNYRCVIDKILEKKGELTKGNEKETIVEQKIPFVIIFNNAKRDDTTILKHINYIPKSNSQNDDINNLKKKLISIDAYYNEKGTLYKELLSNSFSPLSIKIILFGKAGAGKSTFINTSFGELVSKSSGSMKSVTSKCTEYLLPYRINSENEDPNYKGRIMLIDTPGFENEDSVKIVKNEIEKYTKNAKDTKDMVHCALFFLKEGDRIYPFEEQIFKYIFEQKIELFFVITRNSGFDIKTKSNILDYFKKSKYKVKEENIIPVNLVKQKFLTSKKKKTTQEIPIIGVEDIYDAIYNYFKPDIYNDKLFKSLENPKNIEEKLKVLQKVSILFNEFNSIEDLKKGSHSKGKKIVAASASLCAGCGFIPFPFGDLVPVIGLQIGMIVGLAKVYEIKKGQYNLKDIILSGGCSLGDMAINGGIQSSMEITKQGFKTVFKEAAEEVVDDVAEHTVKTVVKEVLKEGGEKGTSGIIKFIPGVGTLIGGLVSAAINGGFTVSMGLGTMKLFENKLLGDDNGYTFLINRIKRYQNIFSQLKFYSVKDDWGFEEWEE